MDTPLNPDMRGISRIENGYSSDLRILCSHCGLRPICSDFAATTCDLFTPIISFRRSIGGWDGVWNTFRIGSAWNKRLRVGDLIGLFDSTTKEIFAYARVRKLAHGKKEDMAAQHGADNHNIRALTLEKADIPTMVLKRLRKAYGNRIYESSAYCTVIYLEIATDIKTY